MPDVLCAGVPVADFQVARAWYERLFGRPPEVLPHETEAMWQAAASGWIYVVGDAERAGHALVTLLIDDLDGWLAALAERGVAVATIEEVGGGRKATVIDPDGNRVAFAQVPQEG
jgi:predicted enzyme related to lactoylglutathione lyase